MQQISHTKSGGIWLQTFQKLLQKFLYPRGINKWPGREYSRPGLLSRLPWCQTPEQGYKQSRKMQLQKGARISQPTPSNALYRALSDLTRVIPRTGHGIHWLTKSVYVLFWLTISGQGILCSTADMLIWVFQNWEKRKLLPDRISKGMVQITKPCLFIKNEDVGFCQSTRPDWKTRPLNWTRLIGLDWVESEKIASLFHGQ